MPPISLGKGPVALYPSNKKVKNFFDTWIQTTVNKDTFNVAFQEDYAVEVEIFQLDEQNNQTYGVELLEAFPKTIGAQTLDYSSTGEINKLPVTFSYRWWKNLVDEGDLPVPVESVVTDGVSGVRRQILSNQPKTISKLGDNLNSKR